MLLAEVEGTVFGASNRKAPGKRGRVCQYTPTHGWSANRKLGLPRPSTGRDSPIISSRLQWPGVSAAGRRQAAPFPNSGAGADAHAVERAIHKEEGNDEERR